MVYDVTDEQSFQSCAKWLERVKAQKAAPELFLPGIVVEYCYLVNDSLWVIWLLGVLVANKVDLVLRRVVTEEEGRAFAKANELEYFECSAVSWSLIILV